MASISNRGEYRWMVRIHLGRDENGKQKYECKMIHGKKSDAQRWARDRETEIDLGVADRVSGNLTLTQQITEWLKTKKGTVAARTLESYQSVPDLYLGELAETKLAKIEHKDLSDLFIALRARGLSPRILRRVHLVLKAAFRLAHTRGQLRRDVMASIPAPKNERIISIKVFTREEARAFLTACAGTKHDALFHLALETGLRPEEYLALRWSDVDLKRGEVSVRQVIIHHSEGWEFSEKLKTKRARRTVPLSPALLAKIKALPQEHALVFPNEQGQPLDINNLRRRHFKAMRSSAR